MTLTQLNQALGLGRTDKGDVSHSFRGRSNLDIYEAFFAPWRTDSFDFLEIGVREGGSMRLWSRYFTAARIHGLDIDPACATGVPLPRVTVTIGSQADPAVLRGIADGCRQLRVVLDDGSHLLAHMLVTFRELWPRLASPGLYVFEDVAITRHGVDGGWPGMRYNATLPELPRADFDAFILSHLANMDARVGETVALHAYYNLLILEKRV